MNRSRGRLLRGLMLGALFAIGQVGSSFAQPALVAPTPAAVLTADATTAPDATPPPEATLTAEPSIVSAAVRPGGTYTTKVGLRAGVALDLELAADGLGQSTDGGFTTLAADEDISPYSARPYVTVAPSGLRLRAGDERDVQVTIHVPKDAGEGTRYAVLRVRGEPAGTDGNVGIDVTLGVSVVIAIDGTGQSQIGRLRDLSVDRADPSALAVTALLANVGNTHYGAAPTTVYGKATLWSTAGEALANGSTTLTGNSIVPTFARSLGLRLEPSTALQDGVYRIEMEAGLADGTILDRTAIEFELNNGAVLGETSAPVIHVSPEAGDFDDGLPLILSGLLGAALATLLLAFIALGRRRRKRPAARQGQ